MSAATIDPGQRAEACGVLAAAFEDEIARLQDRREDAEEARQAMEAIGAGEHPQRQILVGHAFLIWIDALADARGALLDADAVLDQWCDYAGEDPDLAATYLVAAHALDDLR